MVFTNVNVRMATGMMPWLTSVSWNQKLARSNVVMLVDQKEFAFVQKDMCLILKTKLSASKRRRGGRRTKFKDVLLSMRQQASN